jgi:hypothetical protein
MQFGTGQLLGGFLVIRARFLARMRQPAAATPAAQRVHLFEPVLRTIDWFFLLPPWCLSFVPFFFHEESHQLFVFFVVVFGHLLLFVLCNLFQCARRFGAGAFARFPQYVLKKNRL